MNGLQSIAGKTKRKLGWAWEGAMKLVVVCVCMYKKNININKISLGDRLPPAPTRKTKNREQGKVQLLTGKSRRACMHVC